MNDNFLKQILHFNFKKIIKEMFDSVYTIFERNYQAFSKIQVSFGRHVGGQSCALQQGGRYKSYHFVEKNERS